MITLRYVLLLVSIILFQNCQPSESTTVIPLTMTPLFADGMVLQQSKEVAFWGKLTAHQTVKITGSWGKETSTESDETGKWKTTLQTPKAGGPYEVSITTKDTTITLKDILIGEVWVASGQSNMEMPLNGFGSELIDNAETEIANANFPQIRYIDVARAKATIPQDNFEGKWTMLSPETARQFSATAFFFAKRLYQELNVPIGIITTNWGGTPVESWISKDKLMELGEFEAAIATLDPEKIKIYDDWYNQFDAVELPSTVEDWETLALKDEAYKEIGFEDANWKTTTLPNSFEEIETRGNDGAIWFRKIVVIDDISNDYVLHVEDGIDDLDNTYVNGQQVGHTVCWNCPRTYTISKDILKKGENLIAFRMVDTGGGGQIGSKLYLKNQKGKTVDLGGEWKYYNIATLYNGKLVLYNSNSEALQNIPEGLENFKMDSNTPTVLYNGMITPIIPYGLKGVIWYQGESNVGRAAQYEKLFPGMIQDWRTRWNQDFPFYFVQIAPFGYGNELSPALRDAQRKSLKTPKTGMAITMDIGDLKSIHPSNKQDVGGRLAQLALANDYGKDIVASGPLYKSHTTEGNKIIITFDYAEGGLVATNNQPTGFEIADEDGKFVSASAKIIGDKVEVSASTIVNPIKVRYGWKDFTEGTLFNQAGLPASSFSE